MDKKQDNVMNVESTSMTTECTNGPIQTTLTGNGPMILDATCSFSKIWPKIASIRIDVRPECNPDIVMDAKSLKFPNNYFDIIYCDPPHYIHKGNLTRIKQVRRLSGRRSPDPWTRYGFWNNNEEWFDFIEKTNKEFSRCLKPNGILYYKITETSGCTKPKDLIERMSSFEVIEDKTEPTKKGFRNGKIHWIIFKIKDQITQE